MTPRPEVLDGESHGVATKCGKMYITVTHAKNGVLEEIFIHTGSIGDGDKKKIMNPCCKFWTEWMGKLITHHIRNNLKISRIIKQAESTTDCLVSCSNYPDGVNCGKAIASVMRKYVEVKEDSDNITLTHKEDLGDNK